MSSANVQLNGAVNCNLDKNNAKEILDPKIFKREKDRLTIKVSNGKEVIFENGKHDKIKDATLKYFLCKIYQEERVVLLKSIYHLNKLSHIIFVDLASGQKENITGDLFFSPNKNHFLSLSTDISVAGYGRTEISLWTKKQEKWQNVFKKEGSQINAFSGWMQPRWTSDSNVLLKGIIGSESNFIENIRGIDKSKLKTREGYSFQEIGTASINSINGKWIYSQKVDIEHFQ